MFEKLRQVRPEHLAMLARGLLWQIFSMRFGAIVLKGRGARIRLDRRVALRGLIKVGHFSNMDLRFTAEGTIGPNFLLGDFCIFRASGDRGFVCPRVTVAENVSFGPYCNIGGGFGLSVGQNVIAGPYVSIHPEEHGLSTDRPIREQPVTGNGVRIEADCWLSAKSTILDGSHLARGTVLAAGAVLTGGPTEPFSIYAGVPARRIRGRDEMGVPGPGA